MSNNQGKKPHGTDEGRTLGVRLPPVVAEPIEEQTSSQSGAQPNAPGKKKILVVDDNKAAASTLSMVVRMLGNDVRQANDGQEAIQAAAEYLPDIILMDIGMPKVNGYEAARHIRQQPWSKAMILVALTGRGQEKDKQLTKDAGFDCHLVKPVEPDIIQALILDVSHTRPGSPGC